MVVGDDITIGGNNHAATSTLTTRLCLNLLLASLSATTVPIAEEVTEEIFEGVTHCHGLALGVLCHLDIHDAVHRPFGGGRQIHQSTGGSHSRSCHCCWRVSGYCRRCH